MVYTTSSVAEVKPAYEKVKAAFDSGETMTLEYRKSQLKQLGFMIQDNEDAFCDAIKDDLSRAPFETLSSELNPLKGEINEAIAHLKSWMSPQKVKTSAVWWATGPKVVSVPKGTVLIIGTWNFPIVLLLGPLIGAIAAGCPAVIKPAEQAPAVAELVTRLLPLYLDTNAYQVINGAVEQTTELLKCKWDHIFYTGSGNIGRIIAKAAAEHLTSVTLELGGKSPAIVLDDANTEIAARRILWSKFTNSGQICIAADYVICSNTIKPALVDSMKKIMEEFKGPEHSGSLVDDPNYPKIISPNHFGRLTKLLETTKGTVLMGGHSSSDTQKIEPTVVDNITMDDPLLQSEIFGPILPIITIEDKEGIAKHIASGDNPLAIYAFTSNAADSKFIFDHTRSGGFVQNDTLVQFLIPGLPFGGHGASGQGNYHGKASFDAFSHQRAHAVVPNYLEVALASRYPPYTPKKQWMMDLIGKHTIKGRESPRPNL